MALVEGDMQASLAMQRGIPLGKPPVIELRNQHAQYAATWLVPSIPAGIDRYRILAHGSQVLIVSGYVGHAGVAVQARKRRPQSETAQIGSLGVLILQSNSQ